MNNNYDLKAAIMASKKKTKPKMPINNPPKVNPAPNQPSQKNGGLAVSDFEKAVNNQSKDPNSHSTDKAANNPKQKNPNDLNQKSSGIKNPNHDPNNIDPKIPSNQNHTPFQLITQLAQLLQRYGLPTLWEQSFPCPCVASSGYPRTNCPICHGLGLAFKDPVELNIAYQHNNQGGYNGRYGQYNTGLTLATPEMTENGIENGISPRDRLDIDGWTTTQTYLFNVNSRRIQTGEYIPYHVHSIDLATTMDKHSNLIKLVAGKDYTFNKTASVFHPNSKWLNHNISLLMTVSQRFYVTNILKQMRYATSNRLQNAQAILGRNKPNAILTNYVRKYNRAMKPGEVYFRMPKLLQIRPENVVLGNWDFSKNTGKQKRTIKYKETHVAHNPNNPLHIFGV